MTLPSRYANLQSLRVLSGSGGCLALPTISLFLYSEQGVHELGPRAAAAIEHYVQRVGAQTLTTVAGNNGELRDYSPRRLSRDLKQLRAFPADLGAAWVEYDSDPEGWAGEHGLYLYATDFRRYDHERSSCNLLRVDFAVHQMAARGVEALVQDCMTLAELFGFETGNAGLTLKRTSWTSGDATAGVNRLLPRYLGLDPCYASVKDTMRGHSAWCHWINLLGPRLAAGLGGAEGIAARIPQAQTRALTGGGVMIRNSLWPPLGDSNRQAPDVGTMPACASLLEPVVVPISGLGSPHFDVQAWLERFKTVPVGAWEAG
jgi:Protein of unknown function (DUF3396)